jgi:hypothetical protein
MAEVLGYLVNIGEIPARDGYVCIGGYLFAFDIKSLG